MDRAKDMLGSGQTLHVLLVERDDADAVVIEQALTEAGFAYTIERARDDRDFRSLLSARFDIVIADRYFSARDRMRATEVMRELGVDVPLIFISDHPEGKRSLLAREPYLIQVLHDISLRKAEEHKKRVAEARLARRRRMQTVLLECNRALAYESREDRLLAEVCRVLVKVGRYARATIALVMQEAPHDIVLAAAAGFAGPSDPAGGERTGAAADKTARGVIAAGRPEFVRGGPQGRKPEAAGARIARYTLPLHLDGACIAALSIYAAETDAFEDDEIEALTLLAKDLAYAIGGLRRDAAREQAEAKLARMLRARRVMAECNHALVHATDEAALLGEMCRIMVDSGGYAQAWIAFGTGDPRRPVTTAAHAGFGGDQPMTSPGSYSADGRFRGPMARVVSEGTPLIAHNVQADGSWNRDRARELGYQSAYLLPLASEGRILGGFAVHAREADAFDEDEIALISELVDDIAYGLTALRTRVAREQAERQLRASERRYRDTFNQAAVGIIRVDLHGVLADVNQKFCDMLGYSVRELVGKRLRDITHADDLAADAGDTAKQQWSDERRFLARDGRTVWTRRTMSLAREEEGRAQHVIGIVEDITASKALERRFEATFNQAAVGIMHTSLDGRVLLVNRRLCEMLGYTAEEFSDLQEQSLHHGGDAQGEGDLERRLVSGEIQTFSFETRCVRKDQRVIWCRRTVSVARDADSTPAYFIRVFEDITERKEVEERYRATVQQAPMGILHTSLKGRILQVNPRFCDIVGYTEAELLRMFHWQIVHPADLGRERGSELQRLLGGDIQAFASDERLVRKGGAVVWVRRTLSVVRDSARAPLYLVRIVEDITREKENEERYRATVDNAPVGIMHTDTERRILHVNRKLCAMLGYAPEELLGRLAMSLVHESERGRYSGRFEDLWNGKIESFVSERPLMHRDGRVVWIRRVVSLVRSSGGTPRYFVQLMEDITETRQAEELYRATFDNAPVGILHTAIDDDRILKVNRKLCEILGYSEEELLRLRTTDLIDPATRRIDRVRYFEQMLAGQASSFASERQFVRKDGSLLWTHRTVSVVRDASGRPLYFIRIIEDISERKRAQQALERTAQLNGLLQALAAAANEAATPEEAFRACLAHLSAFSGWVLGRVVIFGKTEANYDEQLSIWHGASPRWQSFIAASARFRPMRKKGLVNKVFATGKALWLEKLPLDDGEFRRAKAAAGCGLRSVFAIPVIAAGRSYAVIELYSDKSILPDTALLDVVPNITAQLARVAERHFAGNALLDSERFARATMDGLSQHICVVDEDGAIIAVNKSWRAFATDNGYAPSVDWEGENFFQVSDKATGMSAAEVAYLAAGMRDVLAGALDEFTTEYSCRTNAEQRWFAVKVTRFPGGGPKRAVISFENITERALSLRRRAMEHAVTRVLAESPSLSEAMPRLIRTMCEAMDWAYGALWGYQPDDRTLRRLEYWSEMPLELEPEDARYWQAVDPTGEGGLLRRGVHEREPTWIVDVQADTSFRRRVSAQKLGLVSAYAFPIIATNDVIGVMEFFGRDVRHPDEMLLLVTRSVGSQIGQYIQRRQAEQALRESEEKFKQLAGNIPQVFWISDASMRETIYLSAACEQILGVPTEALKRNPRLLVRALHPEDRARIYHARKRATEGDYDETYRIVRPDGSVRWVHDRAFPVRDADNRVYRIAGIAEDITHRKEAEEKLVYLAHFDALTGLPNRHMFYDRLTQAMTQARRRNKLVAVMFLDLDRFKVTNDTLGHSAGDELLVQVGRRLAERVRVGDTVGRFGGDEFGLILSDLRNFEDGRAVADKIMGAFREPFALGNSEVYVSGSIGISMYPADSDDEGTLMKNADAAMYRAKEAGRNNYQFYTAEMNARALHRLDMENSLRRALERREFRFHYQPKVDLITGRITGMEALLRWMRPGRGMVQPVEFVPLLEDTGLIISIGEWLLDEACNQLKIWQRAGAHPVPIAINVSARQFASKDLGVTIQRALDRHRVPADLLQLELTESSLMINTDDAVQILRYLKSLGVHLSIDDFGTGYSSLAYLQRFPIDALKIDRSFVSDITSDQGDATIIRAVIGMAHNLGLKVVAEGVESEAQLSFLVANGCDEMQGFYYSPPLAGEECLALLLDPPPLRRGTPFGDLAGQR